MDKFAKVARVARVAKDKQNEKQILFSIPFSFSIHSLVGYDNAWGECLFSGCQSNQFTIPSIYYRSEPAMSPEGYMIAYCNRLSMTMEEKVDIIKNDVLFGYIMSWHLGIRAKRDRKLIRM